MLGSILVKITFVAAIAATFLFFLQHRKASVEVLRLARIFYYSAVVGVVSIAGLLLSYILTHQFHYYYVWSYSSTDLPLSLLISTLYAGQEGSFLLWALFTGIIGVFLLRYSSKKGYEPELMTVYTAIFSCLILMLVVKNPFKFIWEQFPNELLRVGNTPGDGMNFMWVDQARGLWSQIPVEGKGLNVLLQNYWMVIHPPILFIGFTSMSIPFAYAVAGMLKRDYVSWIKVATPWTVFGSLALGTGIILGGYWAYETLGWGGYWGWDPVENSSLVPWLVCIASIHTMLAQRKNGSYIKTNFILSMLCFILVLYSTFLTRSGVLGETSVHSFVDPGMWVYWLLLGVIGSFVALGFGLLIKRWKEIPVVPVEHSLISREFALFLGASALVFAAIFILIGTSSPIITNIIKGKTSAVDPNYYVSTTLPLGVVIALLMGIGQLLWWKSIKSAVFAKQLILPSIVSLLFTGITYVMGAHHISMVIFIFASAFALVTNLIVGYRIIIGNPKMAGGAITHIGIAVMFLGFVASSKYDEAKTVSLEQGKEVEALGYVFKYVGYQPMERGRYAFNVEVTKDGHTFIVSPVMFQDAEKGSLIRNPDVVNLMTKDFYVSPLSLEAGSNGHTEDLVTVTEAAPVEAGGMRFHYNGYAIEKGTLSASVEVTKDGKTDRVKLLMKNMASDNIEFVPAAVHNNIVLTISSLNPNPGDKNLSSITIRIDGLHDHSMEESSSVDTLIIEASIKPYINLVWMGTFILIIGFIITIVRRWEESLQNIEWKS
jgi:cytochrome c-type biogenesis protein CcmF